MVEYQAKLSDCISWLKMTWLTAVLTTQAPPALWALLTDISPTRCNLDTILGTRALYFLIPEVCFKPTSVKPVDVIYISLIEEVTLMGGL